MFILIVMIILRKLWDGLSFLEHCGFSGRVIQLTLDATEASVASIRQVDEAASERWGRR